MPIPDEDIAAIAESRRSTIDRYCRRLYARLHRLLNEAAPEDPELTYEALWGAFLSGWIRTVPVAQELCRLCVPLITGLPTAEWWAALAQIGDAAETITLRTGVILSFDETSRLRISLEHWHWGIRRRKDRILLSMEEADLKASDLREPLRGALSANGFDRDTAATASYALTRLLGACALFGERTDEFLSLESKPRIYAVFSSVFALLVELYARGYEFQHIFGVAKMGDHRAVR